MKRPPLLPAAILGLALSASTSTATELRIGVEGPRVRKAELLLSWWGDTERIPLAFEITNGRAVWTLPLDADWLRTMGVEGQLPDHSFVYLQFENGYASIRSESFGWIAREPDSKTGPDNSKATAETTVDFGRGQAMRVRAGEVRELVLTPRAVVSRQLRFIDDDNRPVTDITVSAHMFWSRENRMGVLSGIQPLVEGLVPNAQGVVTVPDGDFEYAIDVDGRHLDIDDPDAGLYLTVVTRLTTAERIIRIRRHRPYKVSLQVLIGNQPAQRASLTGSVSRGCAGACSGGAGVLDDQGRITIPDFYPEEMVLCLGNESGKPIWWLTPEPAQQTARLPAGTRLGRAENCYRP